MIRKEKFHVIKIKAQRISAIRDDIVLHFAAWLPIGRVK